MPRYKTPTELDLKGILGVLIDGMEIKPGQNRDLAAGDGYLGVYVDDEDNLVAACLCDVEFAAYAACSLTMMPPRVAEASVTTGKLEDNMLDNLGEVFNILSRLFVNNDTDHLRFQATHAGQNLPSEISESLSQAREIVSFEISIPRYGDGTLSMLVT